MLSQFVSGPPTSSPTVRSRILGTSRCAARDALLTQDACHRQGQALPEDVARLFFQQIMVAVDYSHRMGVANRDIKLDNILLHRQVRCAGDCPVCGRGEGAGTVCPAAGQLMPTSNHRALTLATACQGMACGALRARSLLDPAGPDCTVTTRRLPAAQDSAVVVKLCDFGFSKDEDRNSGSKSGCGTPEYVAPEVRSPGPPRAR